MGWMLIALMMLGQTGGKVIAVADGDTLTVRTSSETRAGVYSIRQVTLEEPPGTADSISVIVHIVNIPEGTTSKDITDRLAKKN